MDPKTIKTITTAFGISVGVLSAIMLIGLGMNAYGNYFKIKETKLHIKLLEKELADKGLTEIK